MIRWTVIMASVGLLVSACAMNSGTENEGSAVTKDEVRSIGKADDGVDYCEKYGWYGDGECDQRLIDAGLCAGPDPDCARNCIPINVGDLEPDSDYDYEWLLLGFINPGIGARGLADFVYIDRVDKYHGPQVVINKRGTYDLSLSENSSMVYVKQDEQGPNEKLFVAQQGVLELSASGGGLADNQSKGSLRDVVLVEAFIDDHGNMVPMDDGTCLLLDHVEWNSLSEGCEIITVDGFTPDPGDDWESIINSFYSPGTGMQSCLDRIDMSFTEDDTGTFDLAAVPNDDPDTCEQCLMLVEDGTGSSNCVPSHFRPVSGIVTIDRMGAKPNQSAGSLSDVVFFEMEDDQYTPMLNGRCMYLRSAAWDTM
ncbi:MAG: hypothetical protein J7M25_09880 [Deltaproteobacteria bacterium]|nr:hypothetical protein [Deltaproteobacteria bacterium]